MISRFVMKGYCFKCRAKQDMRNVREVYTRNGRRLARGSCGSCGTGVSRFMKAGF